MLEIFLLILPFLMLLAAVTMLFTGGGVSPLRKQIIYTALLLALQAFCMALLTIHYYRRSESYLSQSVLELRREEEAKQNLQFKQAYLRNDILALYIAAFILPFGGCVYWFYSQVKKPLG